LSRRAKRSAGGLLTPAERDLLGAFARDLRARLGEGAIDSLTVFGSRARGDAGEESDLDVAVQLSGREERSGLRAVQEAAADVSSEDIHLRPIVIFPQTPVRPGLRAALDREGVTIYRRDGGPGD